MYSLVESREAVNNWLERYGVRFGIYKNGKFKEQLFPFDPIPRVITPEEWAYLEKGLSQRVRALNLFLADIYGEKNIIKNDIVPKSFVYASKGYLPQCEGIRPPHGVFAHIAGIDLVQAKDGQWFVLEDNLRIPSGASYPLIARSIARKVSPETFSANHIEDNRDYPRLLKNMMDSMNVNGGLNVVFTPGRYNSAFFEHSYLAERTGSVLAFPGDLIVEGNHVYYQGIFHEKTVVGAIYRRVSDEYLDPMFFEPTSLLGVGVADDKGLYYFVPRMVEYYLGEKAILQNAPTYLPYYEEDRKYVLANTEKLVIKDVSEAGGYGVVFGRDLEHDRLEKLKELIRTEPRRWIAQEVINFKDLETMENHGVVYRKADLRAFVLSSADETVVWKSGLTRFARQADSFVVNSSQGGGFKDTWVMRDHQSLPQTF